MTTPFQLISGFFHVNQGILCSEYAEQASSRGVLEGGATGLLHKGGGATGFLEQQAVEFPQVQTSLYGGGGVIGTVNAATLRLLKSRFTRYINYMFGTCKSY